MKMHELYENLGCCDLITLTGAYLDDVYYAGRVKSAPDCYDNYTVVSCTEIDYREYHITIAK